MPELSRNLPARSWGVILDADETVLDNSEYQLGIEADLVLCQPPGESDKNPRFQRVERGTAAPGVGPLTVVAWFGDNILDFPGMTQAVRNDSRALAEFGNRYFILPNPMYGSWTQNRDP